MLMKGRVCKLINIVDKYNKNLCNDQKDPSNDYQIYVDIVNKRKIQINDCFSNPPLHSLSFVIVSYKKETFNDLFWKHSRRTGKYGADLYGGEKDPNNGYLSKQVYSTLQDERSKPSKLTLIILCFLFELDYDQSVELLASCGEVFNIGYKLDYAAVTYIKAGDYNLRDFDAELVNQGIASLLESKRIKRDNPIE